VLLAREYAYILNWSVERIYQSCYLFSKILAKTKLKDITYLTSKEVTELKEINPEIIKERKKGFAYIHTKEHLLLTTKDYEQIKEWTEKITEVKEETNEVKGMGVYHEKVEGRAVIIKKDEDLKKVREGDIIICSMTSPNYIVVMEKAAGWVTDEGGMLSHAAIISREMKKPCVVGTKIATKIFKDDDIIEIDGKKGVARKK
jgi:phosphoenolpyruvate synthase/pyruvate phosphate dikinase